MRISDWSLDVCSSDLWRPEEAGPMQVVSGPIGREKVHYEAPEAGRLDAEMPAFLDWFEGESGIDPARKSGVEGKSVCVRVHIGGRTLLKKKNNKNTI